MDYSKFIGYAGQRGSIGSMVVRKSDHPQDSDLAELNENNRFIAIHRKPHASGFPLKADPSLTDKFHDLWGMTGIYYFSKQILDFIPENQYCELDHAILPKVIAAQKEFYGYKADEYIKDIGTLERLKEVESYLKML